MDFTLQHIAPQHGRVAIVTGANNGIGLETATGLAKHGLRVVLACRDIDKGKHAGVAIKEKIPNADLDVIKLDLGDTASVKAFVREYKHKYDRLDILVNNAGIMRAASEQNGNGVESPFAVNHLGHFLLTKLLIGMMPNDPASRIISLSSVAHKQAKIYFGDLSCSTVKKPLAAYGQSKLACLMFGDELDKRLKEQGKYIQSLAVHPGGSKSGLFDNMPKAQQFIFKVLAPFTTHAVSAAAEPTLVAALSPEVEGGAYLGPQGFQELKGKVGLATRSDYSKDREVAKKLWSLSEQMTEEGFQV